MRFMANFPGITALLPLAFCLAALTVNAQNYSIDWFTIDGGGGTSSGGQYTLTGTIGQPDTGRSVGGNYVLELGFWAIPVQQVGAPTLFITALGANTVQVWWEPQTPGFVLQESMTLGPTEVWNPIGAANPATITIAPPGRRFYRLHRP